MALFCLCSEFFASFCCIVVGMLYTGETPGVKALEENMAAYFNMLQGFLLLSHGSSIGAGPTLSSCIHKAGKQVVDSSFMLLREAVSSYGNFLLPTVFLFSLRDRRIHKHTICKTCRK